MFNSDPVVLVIDVVLSGTKTSIIIAEDGEGSYTITTEAVGS